MSTLPYALRSIDPWPPAMHPDNGHIHTHTSHTLRTHAGVSPPPSEGPAPFLQGGHALPTNNGDGEGEEDLHQIATMIEHLRCVLLLPAKRADRRQGRH